MRHVTQYKEPYLILSAELKGLRDYTNEARTWDLEQELKRLGVGYKRLQGCYKGSTETSFVVEYHVEVLNLAGFYGQESVLRLEPNNSVVLIDVKTKQETPIGVMRAVSKAQALKLDNWSYRPDQDQYYSVE